MVQTLYYRVCKTWGDQLSIVTIAKCYYANTCMIAKVKHYS